METLCPTSAVPNSGWVIHQQRQRGGAWTKEENKRFESALAIIDDKTPNRWFKVAEMIPGKSVCDVINQYRELVADVCDIEAGLVPIPGYLASSFTLELADQRPRNTTTTSEQERKKGVPWTEEEHRRFLLGLEKHGKGDWRNISRKFVVSKTPTQVASHAQKYYLRQLSGGKDKRRPSIHDITAVHLISNKLHQQQQEQAPPRLLEKSAHDLISTTTAGIVMDWNSKNEAAAALTCGDSFLDISSHCIFNIGASAPGFYINSPRFYG